MPPLKDDPPACEGDCGERAALLVNGHPVCLDHVDLASEAGEVPEVEEL